MTGAVLVAGPAGSLRDANVGMPRAITVLADTFLPGALDVLGRVPLVRRVIRRQPYLAIARVFMCDASASRRTVQRCAAIVSLNALEVLAQYARAAQIRRDGLAARPGQGTHRRPGGRQ